MPFSVVGGMAFPSVLLHLRSELTCEVTFLPVQRSIGQNSLLLLWVPLAFTVYRWQFRTWHCCIISLRLDKNWLPVIWATLNWATVRTISKSNADRNQINQWYGFFGQSYIAQVMCFPERDHLVSWPRVVSLTKSGLACWVYCVQLYRFIELRLRLRHNTYIAPQAATAAAVVLYVTG